jgi:Fic-DOC domain mobile mystery protein B
MSTTAGSTPLYLDDAQELIPNIATVQERDEWERLNILSAQRWAFNPRALSHWDPLDEAYVRRLHKEMFGETWRWAGTYRRRDGLAIGCPFYQIRERIGGLLGDVKYQVEHNVFDIDEIAVRFHHRLVWQIHAFPNGNGRHARMIADVLVVKRGRPRLTWGRKIPEDGARSRAYMAALHALDARDADVQLLLEFARS